MNTLGGVFGALSGFAPSLIVLCLTIYSFMLGIGYISGNAKPINKILFELFLIILVGAAAMNYKFLAEPKLSISSGFSAGCRNANIRRTVIQRDALDHTQSCE